MLLGLRTSRRFAAHYHLRCAVVDVEPTEGL